MDPRVGSQLGSYKIEQVLGRGGMSVVYLAEDARLKRRAALKVLSEELAEDETFRARFVSESERLASLDHPNIIPIFEAGEIDGLLFIAMRYVDTTDLRGLITANGRLDPDRTISIIAQTASALDAAHGKALVHRDVKPANILVAVGAGPEGSDHVYLSDFGLTKHTASRSGLTKTGHFMGTIDYVAPEQIMGREIDGRTDQYALACVLFECLTGQPPFLRVEEAAVLFAHLQEEPPRATTLRPDLPPEIDEVIATAMAKDMDVRYPTCTDLARAARKALHLVGSAQPEAIATAQAIGEASGSGETPVLTPEEAEATLIEATSLTPISDELPVIEAPASLEETIFDEPITGLEEGSAPAVVADAETVEEPIEEVEEPAVPTASASIETITPEVAEPPPEPEGEEPSAEPEVAPTQLAGSPAEMTVLAPTPTEEETQVEERPPAEEATAATTLAEVREPVVEMTPPPAPVIPAPTPPLPPSTRPGDGPSGPRGPRPPRTRRAGGRRAPVVGGIVTLVVLLVAGTVFALTRGGGGVDGTATSPPTGTGTTGQTGATGGQTGASGGTGSAVVKITAPQHVSFTSGFTDITLTWEPPGKGDLAGYAVFKSGKKVQQLNAKKTQFTFSGLAIDSSVKLAVQSFGKDGSKSDPVEITASTNRPPGSQGVFSGSYSVHLSTSGDSKTHTWTFSSSCSIGPCSAHLTDSSFSALSLTLSSSHSGTDSNAGNFSGKFCQVQRNVAGTSKITISLNITGATPSGSRFIVTSFSGSMTETISFGNAGCSPITRHWTVSGS